MTRYVKSNYIPLILKERVIRKVKIEEPFRFHLPRCTIKQTNLTKRYSDPIACRIVTAFLVFVCVSPVYEEIVHFMY